MGAMDIEALKHLESKIEEVLTRHAAVCEERDRLRAQLGEAHDRLERMVAEVRQNEAERNEVRARVERIMGRLAGLDLG
jgi:septal ring factor EnvC (AmiA/AmiB activator)